MPCSLSRNYQRINASLLREEVFLIREVDWANPSVWVVRNSWLCLPKEILVIATRLKDDQYRAAIRREQTQRQLGRGAPSRSIDSFDWSRDLFIHLFHSSHASSLSLPTPRHFLFLSFIYVITLLPLCLGAFWLPRLRLWNIKLTIVFLLLGVTSRLGSSGLCLNTRTLYEQPKEWATVSEWVWNSKLLNKKAFEAHWWLI